jgi:hypothetical protein
LRPNDVCSHDYPRGHHRRGGRYMAEARRVTRPGPGVLFAAAHIYD